MFYTASLSEYMWFSNEVGKDTMLLENVIKPCILFYDWIHWKRDRTFAFVQSTELMYCNSVRMATEIGQLMNFYEILETHCHHIKVNRDWVQSNTLTKGMDTFNCHYVYYYLDEILGCYYRYHAWLPFILKYKNTKELRIFFIFKTYSAKRSLTICKATWGLIKPQKGENSSKMFWKIRIYS